MLNIFISYCVFSLVIGTASYILIAYRGNLELQEEYDFEFDVDTPSVLTMLAIWTLFAPVLALALPTQNRVMCDNYKQYFIKEYDLTS